MSPHRREQILENCRWLLDKEVQIITFVTRKYFNTSPVPGCSQGLSELHYYAAVLPRQCSLKSLARSDIEDKIIFKEFSLLSTDGAIRGLHESIEKRIGRVLEEDEGHIRINVDELPTECTVQVDERVTPANMGGDSTATFVAQANGLLEGVWKSGEEVLDSVRKKCEDIERDLVNSRNVTRLYQGLPSPDGGGDLNTEPVHAGLNRLTNQNLALLEKESTREESTRINNNPRGSPGNMKVLQRLMVDNTLQPKESPVTGSHEMEKSKPTSQSTPHNMSGLVGLNIELGTPSRNQASSLLPILTPTSSTVSDTTITSRPDPISCAIRALIRDEIELATKENRYSGL